LPLLSIYSLPKLKHSEESFFLMLSRWFELAS
jgi:hypothetical protein